MTPSISTSSWAKPALLLGGLVVLSLLAMQLAGLFFCGFTGAAKPADVTPWTIYQYWYWYGRHPIWHSYLVAASAVAGLALLVPVGVVLLPGRKKKLHGEARWAKRSEIRKAGLFGHAGIIIGKLGLLTSKFLLFNGAEQGKNVLVAAAPGSGKTQGLMLPNCLNWPGSLVALDVKADCFTRTAGFRQSVGQSVYRLNFLARDYCSHQYNAFAYVSENPHFRVSDVEKISRYLCPDPPPPADDFWSKGARGMFTTIAFYFYDLGQEPTLGNILRFAESPEGLQPLAKQLVKDAQAGKLKLSDATMRGLAKIAQRPEKTHGGMLDQLTNALAPLRNPIVDFATSANSFDLRKLREHPMSIYLTVLRPDVPALSPIINLFFQQLVDLTMTVEFGHDPAHRHEVLLAMDEFAQLGKLDAIFNGITLFRSYGLRLLAIVQAVPQLRETYGENATKTFEGCFDCSVFFTPAARDLETAKTLSELLGTDTVKGRSESKRKGFDTAHDSATTSDQRRSLMLPQEILRMPLRKQVVLISGMAPLYCDKIKAWKDGALLARNGAPPSTPTMDIAAIKPHIVDISHAVEWVIDRPIEASDMGELEVLTLDDFSCDFSSIDVPQGKLDTEEIAALRDRFLDALTVEQA